MTGRVAGVEPNTEADRASFGFRDIDIADKQDLVDAVFDQVAGRYDLMNDLMSGGLHRLWKDAMVSWLAPPRQAGERVILDVAGGTGDIAFRIADRSQGSKIIVTDINKEMLGVGRTRAAKRRTTNDMSFVVANAEDLPCRIAKRLLGLGNQRWSQQLRSCSAAGCWHLAMMTPRPPVP